MKPLCFILMPFGKKKDRLDRIIDFDMIYDQLIKPAVSACNLEPIRADEEVVGGIIHKPMFERLILCEYAIADLTTSNANVFYELGIRHAIRPHTTIPISAFDGALPFDLVMQRTLKYTLDDQGELIDIENDLKALIHFIKSSKNDIVDSPVYELVDDLEVNHSLSHEKTDVFREQAHYNKDAKSKLQIARNESLEALKLLHKDLSPLDEREAGVVIDLFLSYRGYKAWENMIGCYSEMNRPLQNTKLVQEQLALAYNRIKERNKSVSILNELIQKYGPDSETNGLLGRVYKDLWKDEIKAENKAKASGFLKKAIKCYRDGFDTDWRDAYPGINLVTLLKVKGDEELLSKYLPIVRFAVERKVQKTDPDYWDLATLLELAVIGEEFEKALEYLEDALPLIPDQEYWMAETTVATLEMLKQNSVKDDFQNNIKKLIKLLKSAKPA